jgi:hypothetical protein
MTNNELCNRLHGHLRQLAPHQRDRETGVLLLQSLQAIETLQRREMVMSQVLEKRLGIAEATRLLALRDSIEDQQGS